MPSQALASAKEGVESRRRAPTAYKATVKACSRPRTRAGVLLGAAKAEVAGKSAALKSVSVRLRPRAPPIAAQPQVLRDVHATVRVSPPVARRRRLARVRRHVIVLQTTVSTGRIQCVRVAPAYSG